VKISIHHINQLPGRGNGGYDSHPSVYLEPEDLGLFLRLNNI
tara:strand:- start:653 stop:778 length:126 start_codon:yes stop_codon:yes gene_type:complete